ncbi:MAG: hypothetical protein ACRD0K_08970 [Egibacteraceae bacterium]
MNWQRAALLVAGAAIVLGSVLWLAFATSQASTTVVSTQEVEPTEAPSPDPEPTEAPSPDPEPTEAPSPDLDTTPPPPTVADTPPPSSPDKEITALHVLCEGAHLLLTADTYYRAETPEEEERLTALFGDPVTNVDPSVLPPKSPRSVTEVLDDLAA